MSGPLDESRRTLEAAQLLARGGFHDDAVSRAYYAMFTAARTAVRAAGAEPRTHAGVASEFSRLYVRTGRVAADTASDLRRLATKRAGADYEDVRFSERESSAAILAARRFVESVAGALGAPLPVPAWATFTPDQKRDLVAQLTREMDAAAEALAFEKAAELRDAIAQIEATLAA